MKRFSWLLLLAWLAASPARGQIVIDTSMDDWNDIAPLYATQPGQASDSPLGKVEAFRAAYDRDYLFLQIEFAEPRPFLDASRPEKLVDGVWDDFQYVEIDMDLDGRWDYLTQLTTGMRSGINNLALLNSNPNGTPKQRVLYPEGHKNYMPLGPRACFGMRGRAVEMRLPREPLGIGKNRDIALRVRMRYRDTLNGSGDWVTEYLPREAWIKFRIGETAEVDPTQPGAVPTAARDEAARPLTDSDVARRGGELKSSYALPSLNAEPAATPKLISPQDDRSRGEATDLPGAPRDAAPQGEVKVRQPDRSPDPEQKVRMPDGWSERGLTEETLAEMTRNNSTGLPPAEEMPDWMKRGLAQALAEEEPTSGSQPVKNIDPASLDPRQFGLELAPEDDGATSPGLSRGKSAIDMVLAELDGPKPPTAGATPAATTSQTDPVAALRAELQAYEVISDAATPAAAAQPAPAGALPASPTLPQAAPPAPAGPGGAIDLSAQLDAYDGGGVPGLNSADPAQAAAAPAAQPTPPPVVPQFPASTPSAAEPGRLDISAQLDAYDAGGGAVPTQPDAARPIPTATPQPTLTPTPTLTPAPTPTPTATPEPTPTPTPRPTATPTPEPGMEPLPADAYGAKVLGAAEAPIAQPGNEPIVIDGRFDDWPNAQFVFSVPTQRKITAPHGIAVIDRVSLAASPAFLYVRIDFDESRREHLLGGAQAGNLLDAGSYLRLEADGNALWDYEVKLVPKPIAGPQNAAMIPCMVINAAGKVVLLPATDEHGRADGPLACMDTSGKSIELRLPRAPLHLDTKRPIFLRAMVRYLMKDSPWQTMYYPGSDTWFAGDLSR